MPGTPGKADRDERQDRQTTDLCRVYSRPRDGPPSAMFTMTHASDSTLNISAAVIQWRACAVAV